MTTSEDAEVVFWDFKGIRDNLGVYGLRFHLSAGRPHIIKDSNHLFIPVIRRKPYAQHIIVVRVIFRSFIDIKVVIAKCKLVLNRTTRMQNEPFRDAANIYYFICFWAFIFCTLNSSKLLLLSAHFPFEMLSNKSIK